MLIEEVLDRTRAVVREIVAPRCEAEDREAQWPEESLRAFQASGLGGLVVPVAAGGLGLGMMALARVCEANQRLVNTSGARSSSRRPAECEVPRARFARASTRLSDAQHQA